jgi:hypothetical protein
LGEDEIKMIGVVVYVATGEHTGRKFAFVYCEELGRRVFFHWHKFRGGLKPVIGEQVQFELAPAGIPGRPDVAVDVRPISNAVDAGASALVGGV